MAERPNVMISSTLCDLPGHRKEVLEACAGQHVFPLMMEHLSARAADAIVASMKLVDQAEIYLGIFAHRYGYVPTGSDISLVEMEYNRAVERRLPCLIFLMHEDHPLKASDVEQGEGAVKLAVLKKRLKTAQVINYFKSPADLRTQVIAAIVNVQKEWALAESRQKWDQWDRRVGWLRPVQYFKDRTAELRWLQQQVAKKQVRLVLVCGRGGMGKTALVSKFLEDIIEQDRDVKRICVTLKQAQYRSPDKIMELICETLEQREVRELKEKWQEGASLSEKLEFLFRRSLGRRQCFLVLDNCEDILDEDNRVCREFSDLEEFIEKCVEFDHGARLLVTSRRTLVLSPEVEGRIGGRRVEWPLDRGLPVEEAAALLRDLDSDGTLGIRDADEAVLRALAWRSYGIPRTLETLVGFLRQKRTWTLAALLENDDLLDRLLTNPARELYESLSAEEKRTVQTLAVYDCPVPAGAVKYLLPGLPVPDLLDGLVRNYVVTYADKLFSLLPLDQQYAYGQIPETGDGPTRRNLHSGTAKFYKGLRKPETEWKAIEDLEPQLQEFHHLTCAGLYDKACRLLNMIDREHLALWGHYGLLIDLRGKMTGRITDRELEGLHLGNLGATFLDSGDSQRAIEYSNQALSIAREVGNRFHEGRWIGNIGVALDNTGDRAKARRHFQEALEVAQAIGDRWHEGRWMGNLGKTDLKLGDSRNGVAYLEQALAIARDIDDRRFERVWLAELGEFWASQGENEKAVVCLKEACVVAEEKGDWRHQPQMLFLLGHCYSQMQEKAKEQESYERAVECAQWAHNRGLEAEAYLKLAAFYHSEEKTHEAIRYYELAAKIAGELGNRQAEKVLELGLAETMKAMGQMAQAVLHFERALSLARELGDRAVEMSILTSLGATHYALQEIEQAIGCYEQALVIAREMGDSAEESISLFNIGDAFHTAGKLVEAARHYEQALALDVPITSYKCAAGLGVVKLQQGREAEAKPHLSRCAELCQSRLEVKRRLYPEYSTLVLALLGLDQPEEGLAALRAGLAYAPTESDLYYALQDLLILARVPRAIPGLNEAIQILRKEWEAGGGRGALATVSSENADNVWSEAVRDHVFISYAHEDNESPDSSKRWLDRLLQQLEPLRVQGQVSTWSDRDIDIGEDWHERIQASLMQTKAAVLLVSPAFLASKYIRNSELPALLKNAKDNGVVILPLILRPCLFAETKFKYPDPVKGPQELTLSNLQSANPPDKPLNALSEHEQDQVLLSVAQRLLKLTQLNPQ